MCLLFSLVPASVFTTLSYFVWFAAGNSQGSRQQWGNYLAIWLLIVALGFITCGAYVTFAGLCPMERMFQAGGF
jgi:hypothetical protein